MTSYSVALSGSGFLFPVHCGALEALSTLGTIDEVVGTSGGSLVSAAWIGTKGAGDECPLTRSLILCLCTLHLSHG